MTMPTVLTKNIVSRTAEPEDDFREGMATTGPVAWIEKICAVHERWMSRNGGCLEGQRQGRSRGHNRLVPCMNVGGQQKTLLCGECCNGGARGQ